MRIMRLRAMHFLGFSEPIKIRAMRRVPREILNRIGEPRMCPAKARKRLEREKVAKKIGNRSTTYQEAGTRRACKILNLKRSKSSEMFLKHGTEVTAKLWNHLMRGRIFETKEK